MVWGRGSWEIWWTADEVDGDRLFEVSKPEVLTPKVSAGRAKTFRSYDQHQSFLLTPLREIERRCQTDVAFRWLSAKTAPDYRSVSRFGRRHLAALDDLFAQVLVLCANAGLIKLGRVALDVTKLDASASKHTTLSSRRLVKRIPELEAEAAADEFSQIIERVFGQTKVKQNAGLLRLRGLAGAQGEFALHALCHNLRKFANATPAIADWPARTGPPTQQRLPPITETESEAHGPSNLPRPGGGSLRQPVAEGMAQPDGGRQYHDQHFDSTSIRRA